MFFRSVGASDLVSGVRTPRMDRNSSRSLAPSLPVVSWLRQVGAYLVLALSDPKILNEDPRICFESFRDLHRER